MEKDFEFHTNLKLVVFVNGNKSFSCYRATIGGGLDYCNNKLDDMWYKKKEISEDANAEVVIYDKVTSGSKDWRERKRMVRQKETMFNH